MRASPSVAMTCVATGSLRSRRSQASRAPPSSSQRSTLRPACRSRTCMRSISVDQVTISGVCHTVAPRSSAVGRLARQKVMRKAPGRSDQGLRQPCVVRAHGRLFINYNSYLQSIFRVNYQRVLLSMTRSGVGRETGWSPSA